MQLNIRLFQTLKTKCGVLFLRVRCCDSLVTRALVSFGQWLSTRHNFKKSWSSWNENVAVKMACACSKVKKTYLPAVVQIS